MLAILITNIHCFPFYAILFTPDTFTVRYEKFLHRFVGNPVISNQGHFVPKSFRTQVISYHFGHFVPTFIFNLVISYPVWSFRTHFVLSLVISYLLLLSSRKPFWSFRTYFLLFRTQDISCPKLFRTNFSHFVPKSFRIHFQTRYELTWVRNDFFFAVVICYLQTRYELTLV